MKAGRSRPSFAACRRWQRIPILFRQSATRSWEEVAASVRRALDELDTGRDGGADQQSRNVELRKQLAQRRYTDPAFIAYESAILGDKEQTFFWLQKAYSERSGGLQFIKIAKPLEPFRSDPRYVDLLTRPVPVVPAKR